MEVKHWDISLIDLTACSFDRDFLLQFMSICKGKPATLDNIGLDPANPLDQASLSRTRGGKGRHRTSSGAIPPSRQATIDLGFSPTALGKGTSSFNPMGNFATVGASKLSSEDRFAASSRAASVSMPFDHPMAVTRTADKLSDIKEMFQLIPSSAPSSNTPLDTSSPSVRTRNATSLSSPRLAPHQHNEPPSTQLPQPHMQPQMRLGMRSPDYYVRFPLIRFFFQILDS